MRICGEAGLTHKPRVVELGCGEGAVAEALADRKFCGSYQGFDISESGIVEARGRKVDGGVFELVSGEEMPMGDDGADLVILSHVVEHLEHPRILIREARRIARHVVVEVPLELNLRIPRDYVWDSLGHINKYTSTSIRHLLQTCDLDVIRQFTTNASKGHALFHDTSRLRRAQWRLKELALATWPPLARGVFTYHETLLARRTESPPMSRDPTC